MSQSPPAFSDVAPVQLELPVGDLAGKLGLLVGLDEGQVVDAGGRRRGLGHLGLGGGVHVAADLVGHVPGNISGWIVRMLAAQVMALRPCVLRLHRLS